MIGPDSRMSVLAAPCALNRGQSSIRRKQRGVALAIVVWFIAGMSLLVAGIVSHARVDTHMAQLHVARAKAAAAGDGAIHLMMADVVMGKLAASGAQGLLSRSYRMGELEVTVDLVPTSGLVDINNASAQILAALCTIGGTMDGGQAKTVADNVVKWRSSKTASRGRARFAAVEDLLRVDGLNRDTLDAVRDYVVAGSPSQRGTDWSVAPETVLAIMRKADPQKAESVMKRRERMPGRSAGPGAGATKNKGAPSLGRSYRMDAVLRYGDKAWLRRRWVSMQSVRSSQLPWRMLRTEAPRVIDVPVGLK